MFEVRQNGSTVQLVLTDARGKEIHVETFDHTGAVNLATSVLVRAMHAKSHQRSVQRGYGTLEKIPSIVGGKQSRHRV